MKVFNLNVMPVCPSCFATMIANGGADKEDGTAIIGCHTKTCNNYLIPYKLRFPVIEVEEITA